MGKSRERNMIASVYDSVSWKRKVRDMGDGQVLAIYYKFLAEGKFDKKPEKKKEEFRQMTIWDFMEG